MVKLSRPSMRRATMQSTRRATRSPCPRPTWHRRRAHVCSAASTTWSVVFAEQCAAQAKQRLRVVAVRGKTKVVRGDRRRTGMRAGDTMAATRRGTRGARRRRRECIESGDQADQKVVTGRRQAFAPSDQAIDVSRRLLAVESLARMPATRRSPARLRCRSGSGACCGVAPGDAARGTRAREFAERAARRAAVPATRHWRASTAVPCERFAHDGVDRQPAPPLRRVGTDRVAHRARGAAPLGHHRGRRLPASTGCHRTRCCTRARTRCARGR